jgi:hypothetical protein
VKWFRRRRRRWSRPFDESALPPPPPFLLDDSVSEGLMLAEYSSRLRLKNRVIVGVLTGDRAFDPAQYLDEAREAIDVLIDEFDLEGTRIARQLRVARSIPGKASHAHDYRSGDAHNLELREEVLAVVTETLRERRADGEYLLELVESARQDAWLDIARAVEDWLDRSSIVTDADYERHKGARMRLVADDLAALAPVETAGGAAG